MTWTPDDEKKLRNLLIEINPKYHHEIGRGFFWLQMPSRASRFYMRETMAWLTDEYSHQSKRSKVLCYGCGVGTFMLYLWHHGFTDVEGCDANLREVETARKILGNFGCPFQVKHVKREDIYNINGQYDIITFFDFLYAYEDDVHRILANAENSLRKDGLLIFDLFEFEKEISRRVTTKRSYYSEGEMRWLASSLGYVVDLSIAYEAENRKIMYVFRKVS